MGELLIERRSAVALLTLNRPQKRNALSIELRVELADALSELGADEEVGCIVLAGKGSAFCAGMDVTQFGGDEENKRRLVESSTAAFGALAVCPRPVVAAVNGPAIAGGFALALLCDLRVADPSATFGFPELPRGVPPSFAAARAVLDPAQASELVLTGRLLSAGEALEWGALTEVCEEGQALDRALALAETIASAPRQATLESKRRILLDRERTFGPLFTEEAEVFRRALLG